MMDLGRDEAISAKLMSQLHDNKIWKRKQNPLPTHNFREGQGQQDQISEDNTLDGAAVLLLNFTAC